MRNDVLIIGAGPTGLVLALWLTKLGVKVRIIDKTAEAGTAAWVRRHVNGHADKNDRGECRKPLWSLRQ